MPKNKNPGISVVTPTFNRANELGDLIDSIQNQTLDHPLFEMIIVDDGSTDNTESLVHSLIEKINFKGFNIFKLSFNLSTTCLYSFSTFLCCNPAYSATSLGTRFAHSAVKNC